MIIAFMPGLHIVVRAAKYACDDASIRILKPSTYRLQIFLVRDQYLRSLLPHRDQAIAGQLEKHVLKSMLVILTTYMETRLLCFSYLHKLTFLILIERIKGVLNLILTSGQLFLAIKL